jgi:hypothetical protein
MLFSVIGLREALGIMEKWNTVSESGQQSILQIFRITTI